MISLYLIRYFLLLVSLYTPLVIAQSDINLVECNKVGELTGTGNSLMSMPTDVAIDQQGRLYVVDSGNHRVLVYASSGTFLFSFGSEGIGAAELKFPVGITSAQDGGILVADRGNRRVQIFNRDGTFIKTIALDSKKAKYTPVDVAVDETGKRFYVSATSPIHQILVLNQDGKVLSKWGKPGSNEGEFRYPATMAVSNEGEIYIVDVLNTRVQVLDKKGAFLVTVGSWGVTQGQLFRPKGVALTSNGLVLVSDSYLGVVQIYNSDTRFKGVLATDGDIFRFNTPVGIAVDDNNRLYIAEALANRVTICQLSL